MSWLTAELPGTGGVYKEYPEDFQVEEIPLYPCCGDGEHLYLWIEKEGISTRELLGQLSRGLQLNERELGYAGLKDARARTRQMISIPAGRADRLTGLQLRKARILRQERHSNKLRLGHLAGNRFTIRLRNPHPQAAQRAAAILQVLEQQG
ncbi:MAG: tRNA pseudouridine(13) synthase TruD, partial [Deltaproteobacteria bacterium]|nr:tRNA pseudouridine(13) synthase TruD [Deltaproteobacteria bacterium]